MNIISECYSNQAAAETFSFDNTIACYLYMLNCWYMLYHSVSHSVVSNYVWQYGFRWTILLCLQPHFSVPLHPCSLSSKCYQLLVLCLLFSLLFSSTMTFNDFSRESYHLTVWLKHSSFCFRTSPSRVFFCLHLSNHYLTSILIVFLQYHVSKAFIHFCTEGAIEVKYGQT